MASPQPLTHSTAKGPSREFASDRRTTLASAASDRTRSTFRDIVCTSNVRPQGCAKVPGAPSVTVQRDRGGQHCVTDDACGLAGPPSEQTLARLSIMLGDWGLSPKTDRRLHVTAVAVRREKSPARRSTRPGSSASAGTLPAG